MRGPRAWGPRSSVAAATPAAPPQEEVAARPSTPRQETLLPELRPAVALAAPAQPDEGVHPVIIATLGLGLGLLAAAALPQRVVAAAPALVRDRLRLGFGLTGLSLSLGAFVALLAAA